MKSTDQELRGAVSVMEQLIDQLTVMGYADEALKFGCHLDDIMDLLASEEGGSDE